MERACTIGGAALASIASTYGFICFRLLSQTNLIDGLPAEIRAQLLAIITLGAGAAAAMYLAARVWVYRCPIAAWAGLLWIGVEALNAVLGITTENPGILCILLFAIFQGVRGCSLSFDEADSGT